MFARAIRLLNGKKIRLSKFHQFVGRFHSRYMPASYQFISVLAVELVTDIYGKMIRKSPAVFEPIRKVSELHHIEEGRHIHYTKIWMKHYTDNAGFLKRTAFSIVVLLNIWYMRSLYVTKENFEDLKTSKVTFMRILYGTETLDYPFKTSLVSVLDNKTYEPENYFIDYLKCFN